MALIAMTSQDEDIKLTLVFYKHFQCSHYLILSSQF